MWHKLSGAQMRKRCMHQCGQCSACTGVATLLRHRCTGARLCCQRRTCQAARTAVQEGQVLALMLDSLCLHDHHVHCACSVCMPHVANDSHHTMRLIATLHTSCKQLAGASTGGTTGSAFDCPDDDSPVCGMDGFTCSNACVAGCASVEWTLHA